MSLWGYRLPLLAEVKRQDGCNFEVRQPKRCEPKRNSDSENDKNPSPRPHRLSIAR